MDSSNRLKRTLELEEDTITGPPQKLYAPDTKIENENSDDQEYNTCAIEEVEYSGRSLEEGTETDNEHDLMISYSPDCETTNRHLQLNEESSLQQVPPTKGSVVATRTSDDVHSLDQKTCFSDKRYLYVIDTIGNRNRVKVRTQRELKRKQMLSRSCYSQLLSVPFDELLRQADEKRYQRAMQESEELINDLRSENGDTMDSEDAINVDSTRKTGKFLWSEKYSPKHFTELLSDDGINRTLLSWLKLWDETVFGSSALLKDSSNIRHDSNQINKKKPLNKKYKQNMWEIQDPIHFGSDEALDESRRPKQKVFLLCGPPGLGKTTLAHVVAIQAGYNVVEVNASDDRSPDLFRKMLESATEMKSVLTANSKPNCLIIDEIDGAPSAAINVLIDVIKTKNKLKDKKKSRVVLSRPIICICNDQYTPSLRNLRQHATVLPVPPTKTGRLATRLLEICRNEQMGASTSILMALCEKADNDIRTCLNTLQFIHCKYKDLSLPSIQSIAIGHKDSQKSILSFWKEVFKLPSSKKMAFTHGDTETLNGSLQSTQDQATERVDIQSNRFVLVLSLANSVGEYEKVLQGLYENYLDIKLRDPNMEIISEIQDWILFHESALTMTMTSQEYILMAYLPFLSVAFHFLFAISSGHRVQYPHSQFEAFQTHQRNQQIISSLVSDISPSVRRNSSSISTINFIPLFMNVVTPTLRPVNTQLYTKWEKQILSNLVHTMISYNLTYRQERSPDGQYTYVLDPDLEELCHFTSQPQKRQLPYATKQMLAREIELEKVKVESKLDEEPNMTNQTSGALQYFEEPKRLRQQNDFFGQPILSRPHLQNKNKDSSLMESSLLWFKFNQGFSHAVKRPIHMKDLL